MDHNFLPTVFLTIALMQGLQTSAAQNYGGILQRAAMAHNAKARTTANDAVRKMDYRSVKSFRVVLEEYAASVATAANDSLCQLHINQTITALIERRQDWAVRMVDAAGKPPAGIMNGNLLWMGNYDECVNITATVFTGPNDTNPTHPFKGRYCNAYLPLTNNTDPIDPMNIKLTLGVCVPDSCSNTSIVTMTRGVFLYAQCQLEELEYDTRAIVAIVILSLLGFLVLVGTAYDVFVIHKLHVDPDAETSEIAAPLIPQSESGADHSSRNIRHRGYGSTEPENQHTGSGDKVEIMKRREPAEIGLLGKLLQAFSVYTNGSKILSTESREGLLGAVNGVRFISMTWVILGHAYVFPMSVTTNTLTFIQENLNNISFMAIYNATVSVDSFFTLSGLLVGYLSLRELARLGSVRRFKWGMFYFHRFWRLTPPYMLVMLLYIPLFKYWYSGPAWPQDGIERDYCEDTWWQNLLYINNFFPLFKQCVGWSWYLANDMQFYVISPLLLVPLYLSNAVGAVVCFIVLLTSWTLTGVVSREHNVPMGFLGTDTAAVQYSQNHIYIRPYYRIGPYIIGMIFGCVLAKTNCKVKMPKIMNVLGWAVAAGCCLSVLYANFDSVRGKHVASMDIQALYIALSRSAWAVGVSWVVFACATGHGGIVNTFLSWKLFLPLSRLTYMAYLSHPVVMLAYNLGKRQPFYMNNMEVAVSFLGTMMVTYAVSFVLSMVFESPFMGLEKVLLKRERKH